MQNIIYHIAALSPELIMVISSLLIILYGSFAKAVNINNLSYCTALILSLDCILLLNIQIESPIIFSQLVVLTSLTQYAKLLILIANISLFLMLPAAANRNKFLVWEIVPIIMLASSGMMIMVSSSNFISLYLGLELMSLCSYILVAINRESSMASEAGIKYFIMGALASCIFLFGTSLIYGTAGSLDFTIIREIATDTQAIYSSEAMMTPLLLVSGVILVLITFAFKVSAAPFHMWTLDVYQGSSWIIVAFLSSAPKIAALFTFARVMYGVFIPIDFNWLPVLTFLAGCSMLVGSIGAIMQQSIKRIMGYSSIGHVGFALIGLAVSNEEGITAFITYITIYLTMNLGMFACFVLAFDLDDGKDDISKLAGLSQNSPMLAIMISIFALSMAGIPPFAGFFAKFAVIYSAVRQEMITLAIIAVISSVIGTYFYLRFIKIIYFDESSKKITISLKHTCAAVAFIMVALNLFYVINPSAVLSLAQTLAIAIFDI